MGVSKAYQEVHEERNNVYKFFQEKWEVAKENAGFMRMEQLSPEQLQKMTGQNRVPYILDFITQPINTIIGDERDSRTDIKYLPREQADDVRAELLNAIKSYVMNLNRWTWLQSDVFQDGIVEKLGVIGMEWSTRKNPHGMLDIFRVPAAQFMWDINRRDFDLEQSAWVSRTRLYTKPDLIRKYPEFKDEIKKMSLSVSEIDDLKLGQDYFKTLTDTDLSAVALIEFYKRTWKTRYFIKEGPNIRDGFYTTKRACEAAIKREMQEAEASYENVRAGKVPQLECYPHSIPVVVKSEVAHNIDFVANVEQDEPFYPFSIYHPYFEDGQYWSVMDLYKDAARFLNKTFSMIDHQMMTSSKGLLLIDEMVPQATANLVIDLWNKTGGAARVPMPKEFFNYIKPESFDPRLLQAIELIVQNIQAKSGGGNYLGRTENAGESGKAIQQRVSRASIASFMIYDNLDRFKMDVGTKTAWYITHKFTAAQKIRIEGEELTMLAQKQFPEWFKPSLQAGVGFVEVNTGPNNMLADLEVDVIVDKSAHAATKNQETLAQIQGLGQAFPALAETMPPQMLVGLFDLPASQKAKMMAAAEDNMKQRLEMQKMEMNKPPTLSANMKDGFLLPPGLQGQFFEKFGLHSTGEEMPEVADGGDQDDKVLEMASGALGAIQKEKELDFKERKHKDQTALKVVQMNQQQEQFDKKLQADKEKADKQAKAAKKSAASGGGRR